MILYDLCSLLKLIDHSQTLKTLTASAIPIRLLLKLDLFLSLPNNTMGEIRKRSQVEKTQRMIGKKIRKKRKMAEESALARAWINHRWIKID
jgi:hypothetical protein